MAGLTVNSTPQQAVKQIGLVIIKKFVVVNGQIAFTM